MNLEIEQMEAKIKKKGLNSDVSFLLYLYVPRKSDQKIKE